MHEETFYQRQVILKEIGSLGQEKLKNAKVLIVGAGGLGHPVASYLAAAGVGLIHICDFDKVEESNLHRQILFSPEDVNKFKAEVLSQKIRNQNPFVKVVTTNAKLCANNIKEIFNGSDIIIDCCDNFKTKFLLHDCAYLLKKDLVQASLYQWEGQLQIFPYRTYGFHKGCFRCLWPKVPHEGCVGNCAQAGVVGAVAGVLGSLQAIETIKLICNVGSLKLNVTTTIDLINMEMNNLKWLKNNECPLCGDSPLITDILETEYEGHYDFEIDDIKQKQFRFVDLRTLMEREKRNLLISSEHFPFDDFNKWVNNINEKEEIVFFCNKGIRSAQIVNRLREKGFTNCLSLRGGLAAHPYLQES